MKRKNYLLLGLFVLSLGLDNLLQIPQPKNKQNKSLTNLDLWTKDKDFRYAETKNLSPYALFGDNSMVLRTKQEREGKHSLDISNQSSDTEFSHLELNYKTGKVKLLDKQGNILSEISLESKDLAKFLSVDPIASSYPELTPYQFGSNSPIMYIDLDGKEGVFSGYGGYLLKGEINNITYYSSDGRSLGEKQRDLENGDKHAFDDVVVNFIVDLAFRYATSYMGAEILAGRNLIPPVVKPRGNLFSRIFSFKWLRFGKNKSAIKTSKSPDPDLLSMDILTNVKGWGAAENAKEHVTRYSQGLLDISRSKRPFSISSVVDSKTGEIYTGTNQGVTNMDNIHPELLKRLPKESSEKWSVYNCAECDAFNKALHNGAEWDDLNDFHTVKYSGKEGTYIDFPRCKNCQSTFEGKMPTSDK